MVRIARYATNTKQDELHSILIQVNDDLTKMAEKFPHDDQVRKFTNALPTVIVVGSQSCGKSSLLDTLIGHDVLPKDKERCTRRPIKIALRNDKNEYAKIPSWSTSNLSMAQLKDALPAAMGEEISSDPLDVYVYCCS